MLCILDLRPSAIKASGDHGRVLAGTLCASSLRWDLVAQVEAVRHGRLSLPGEWIAIGAHINVIRASASGRQGTRVSWFQDEKAPQPRAGNDGPAISVLFGPLRAVSASPKEISEPTNHGHWAYKRYWNLGTKAIRETAAASRPGRCAALGERRTVETGPRRGVEAAVQGCGIPAFEQHDAVRAAAASGAHSAQSAHRLGAGEQRFQQGHLIPAPLGQADPQQYLYRGAEAGDPRRVRRPASKRSVRTSGGASSSEFPPVPPRRTGGSSSPGVR